MIVYDTGHISSEIVCAAIAEGFGCDTEVAPWARPLETPAAFYGRERGTLAIVRQCAVNGNHWIMADNGYMGAGQYDGHYKLSRDGFQCDGTGIPDEKRLVDVLALTGQKFVKDWRPLTKHGHILICPPIAGYEVSHWFSSIQWRRGISKQIRKLTNRKIRIRYKPGDKGSVVVRPLAVDLKRCHALITHDSNIAVEAIMAGIPVFITGTSPAQVFGNVDLSTIVEPRTEGDRWEWLSILANNQWTLNEIRDGMANETLCKHKVRYENRRAGDNGFLIRKDTGNAPRSNHSADAA